jgi:hypothetical protein
MVDMGERAVMFPLLLGAISIVSSIVGTFFVSTKEGGKIMNALYKGVIVSGRDIGGRLLLRLPAPHGRPGPCICGCARWWAWRSPPP